LKASLDGLLCILHTPGDAMLFAAKAGLLKITTSCARIALQDV